jgi:DNA-binding transcriptional regulator YdaS (Cro superfamily)
MLENLKSFGPAPAEPETAADACRLAVKMAGGPGPLGRKLRPPASRQAVAKWAVVPAERAREVERIIGGRISRYQMRPDVFGGSAEE